MCRPSDDADSTGSGPRWTSLTDAERGSIGSASFLPGWRIESFLTGEGKIASQIVKTYDFASFDDAIAFVDGVADDCDSIQHHPAEMSVLYDKVALRLATFDCGCLTSCDVKVANAVDARAREHGGQVAQSPEQLDVGLAIAQVDIECEGLDGWSDAAQEAAESADFYFA